MGAGELGLPLIWLWMSQKIQTVSLTTAALNISLIMICLRRAELLPSISSSRGGSLVLLSHLKKRCQDRVPSAVRAQHVDNAPRVCIDGVFLCLNKVEIVA